MSEIKHGGPAFPVTRDKDMQNDAWGGMTLRDYFAAKALALTGEDDVSVTDVCELLGMDRKEYRREKHWPEYAARRAYEYADAMIRVRGE